LFRFVILTLKWARKGLVGVVNHPEEVQMLQQKILDVGSSTKN
jgi:hypothetical protein